MSEAAANPPSPETATAQPADAPSSPPAETATPQVTRAQNEIAKTGASAPTTTVSVQPNVSSVTQVRFKRVLGRLVKIEIENYRAFRGRFELDLPEGCNLLVYGENGAGKSSLYSSLKDFFESPERGLKIEANRHAFNTDPALIRLSFAAPSTIESGAIVQKPYEWSTAKNESRAAEMRTIDKGKGFLDYRALLRIHLLPKGKRSINLFGLFIDPLLAHYKNPITGLTFSEEWKRIEGPFAPYLWKPNGLDNWIRDFNAGFERVLRDSVELASKILSDFDRELGVDVKFTGATYGWRPKDLRPPTVTLIPSFKRLQKDEYHEFLNEARLSAIATAIYFAGLKQSPVTNGSLLVLDDILIGLDMANRMMVLKIIESLFPDWQVIVMTYHKAWFEVLKARLKDGKWPHDWKVVTIRSRRSMGVEFPVEVATSETFLNRAQTHFDPAPPGIADVKAAAVYARTAFEAIMSWYCAEMRLPVAYVESRRELNTNDFLFSIERQMQTLRNRSDRDFARAVLQEVKHARHFVLNPHSHYNPEQEDEIEAEIHSGIRAVEDFNCLLRCVRRADFADPSEKLETCSVGERVTSSLQQCASGQRAAALSTLACAFDQHLDEWFSLRAELLPHRVSPTPARLFALAGERKLFSTETWTRLKHYKAYLLGDVHVKKFDQKDFQAAAHLLVKLRVCFLMQKKAATPSGS